LHYFREGVIERKRTEVKKTSKIGGDFEICL
jgi:hypothetical protein